MTPHKSKKLFLIGDSAFAEVAYECFTRDSEYEVVGFCVERAFITRQEIFGLPVIAWEDVSEYFNRDEVDFYVSIVYTQLNRLRARFFKEAMQLGYQPASYISTKASVWPNAVIGAHVFIFEGNNLQPFTSIGSNVVLWSGNHIGHHSVIEDNCFVSSHVVISGFCTVGANTFLGVNSTVANNIKIGADNWIGASICITQNTEENSLFKIDAPIASRVTAKRFFRVPT